MTPLETPNVHEMLGNAQQASHFLKALSNEKRLAILFHILNEKHAVGSINEKVPLSQSALSQHLAVLRKSGIVKTERDSQSIYYSIADERTTEFIKSLHNLFSQPLKTETE